MSSQGVKKSSGLLEACWSTHTQVRGAKRRGIPEVRPRVTRHAPQAPTKLFEAKGKDQRAADRCCHPNGGVGSGVKYHSSAAMHEGESGPLEYRFDGAQL